ncbi:MalM family protein [Fulvimonas sp. R45]|uniref:MalM family protein n=1 Tax=Fulvimonas sp. R45 TaxID=3045937 RepID=UPI00265D8ED4|nr:MalM family protein [Fulvimonas sp. R45]MDO1528030.1 MalM family protein [Fulvimonas sp. R45]
MPQRPLATALLIAAIALLGACHSAKVLLPPNLRPVQDTRLTLEQARQALQDATPCCGSFADFSYQNLLPWRPKKFHLGNGSMVADLNGVRSYFLAFSLPTDVKLPYRIGVKSDLNGRWLKESYLFAPTAVLLDDAFQPLDSHDVTLCEYMGWSSDTSGAFGSVTVSDPKARYLVVYSSAQQQAGATYWEQSPASFSVDTPTNMVSNGSFKVPHGPDGTLWVGLMTKSYAEAVDHGICGKPAEGQGLLHTLRTALPVHWSRSGS